ncbi:MAG TPA: hypothetical protein VGI12_09770 [Vicinamibacterales bacterium]
MPDPGFRSPLIDFFRRGEVARDVRLLAAQGALAPRAHEQLALLVLLADDADPDIARATAATLDALPREPLAAFLGRSDVPRETREFFAARGVVVETGAAGASAAGDDPLLDTLAELPKAPDGEGEDVRKLLSSLPVIERVKLAMKGSREQRAQLVRDTNRLVAAAVLSSPKLNHAEVEAFTKMGNVSEDTMRTIATNRGWLKNYGILAGVCRHPKTPPAISMQLLHRLHERDLKTLTTDRNVQEGLRVLARKIVSKGKA